jgi:hypothetical protein
VPTGPVAATVAGALPLGLAAFTAAGLIGEVLIVIKLLLTGRENKVGRAIDTY